MNKLLVKSLSILVLMGVLLIGKSAFAQEEYYLGLLVQEEGKEPKLLKVDPILKHEMILHKYKQKNGLPQDAQVKVLWGGEIKIVDGKYAEFNETSEFAKSKHSETASIRNIEIYMYDKMPECLSKDPKFYHFDENNQHLHESLKKLAELRHEIPNRNGLIFFCVELGSIEAMSRYQGFVQELPNAIAATLKALDYISENSPSHHPSLNTAKNYIIELNNIFLSSSSFVEFRDNNLDNMMRAFHDLQYLEYIDIIEVEPAKKTLPILNNAFELSSEQKITDEQIIKTLRSYTGRQDLNTVEELLNVLYQKIATKLFVEQKDADLFFEEGLYDYMQNNIDQGDNRSMLLIVGARMWSAEQSSFISLEREQLMRIYQTYAETENLLMTGKINDPYKEKALSKSYNIAVPKEVFHLRTIGRTVIIKN